MLVLFSLLMALSSPAHDLLGSFLLTVYLQFSNKGAKAVSPLVYAV